MASVSKVPVSRLIAASEDSDPKDGQKSRGDYKKLKELEEARKLGNAPAAVDEEGRDINPHIPQYISDAPWYLDPKGPTLKHQRPQEDRIKQLSSLTEWYKKGVNTESIATKFRKGACENCGAMTHKKRDCLERPRKIGAKFTNSNFAPDEFVQPNLALSFDGKRDRWNGYDNFAHQEVVEEFQKLETVKRELKKDKVDEAADEEDDGAPSSDEDEDKYVDKMDMPGTKVDAAERYTVRNLRIREDTAKYLRNLDPNSAHYDPKTRSMRKNPYESTGKKEDEVDYAGDNFVRVSGDTVTHAQSQLFAWEAGRKGLDVHALAEPTKLEVLKKEYSTKKDVYKDEVKSKILDKYGGEEYLEAPPKELIFAQTEHYVEYTPHGQVIKGEERSTVKSRYEEDILNGNHTTVWGSFWCEGRWGYKCCHSFLKKSYCTGSAGREQQETPITTQAEKTKSDEPESDAKVEQEVEEKNSESGSESADEEEEEEGERTSKKKKKKSKKKKKKQKKEKKEKKEKDFESEVVDAMKKQEEEERQAEQMRDDRKRSYNNVLGFEAKAPTEAEMEAYYRKRKREDDPMFQFMK